MHPSIFDVSGVLSGVSAFRGISAQMHFTAVSDRAHTSTNFLGLLQPSAVSEVQGGRVWPGRKQKQVWGRVGGRGCDRGRSHSWKLQGMDGDEVEDDSHREG